MIDDYFLRGLIRNINYTKFKTKKNLNIFISKKKKKKTHTHTHSHTHTQKPKFMIFYILKLLHDIFIINLTIYILSKKKKKKKNPSIYISFNLHSQSIIHPLISYLIYLFQKF